MCRFAAYLGPEIPLRDFLLEPAHGLMEQSWEPRELRYAKLNADGFGIGWYGVNDEPVVYRESTPIWADPNLNVLADELSADLWLGFIRSATVGYANHVDNTQPFKSSDLLFCHNGFVQDFQSNLRAHYLDRLSPEVMADIRGNTDSEWLFAHLLQVLKDDDEMAIESAMSECCEELQDVLGDEPALLNWLVSDGVRVYASRYAVNEDAPSLYYCLDNEAFPDGAQLISSEPFDDNASWQAVPPQHLLILDPQSPPELLAL